MAVRLVNTANPGRDQDDLNSLDDLRRFLADRPRWGMVATGADVAAFRELRGRLREVFEAAAGGDGRRAVTRLNGLLGAYPVRPQISEHDDRDWHLHLAEDTVSVATGYGASACMGLAALLAKVGVDRLGVCQAAPCRAVYLDTSTNRSRRYCSERCATRANVAAYRARRRGQAVQLS
ncbi:MAG: CGNR zinc finger domain-containing protein [Carbonactinosporaceae bacterium]